MLLSPEPNPRPDWTLRAHSFVVQTCAKAIFQNFQGALGKFVASASQFYEPDAWAKGSTPARLSHDRTSHAMPKQSIAQGQGLV